MRHPGRGKSAMGNIIKSGQRVVRGGSPAAHFGAATHPSRASGSKIIGGNKTARKYSPPSGSRLPSSKKGL